MRTLKLICALILCSLSTMALAANDAYPSRVIKIIVPWPAGGVADVLGRISAEELSKSLGQTVIVDNKPGAGTNIGSEVVAKADPDGYTLLLGSSNNAVNMTLYKTMRYDVGKDFVPISLLAMVPNILVVNPKVPAKNVKELIEYAKANPGKLKLATAGNGSPAHLAGEQFKRLANVNMLTVPYKGAAPAVTDLIGGFVDVMFTNIPASLGAIKGDRLRALGIGSKTRSPALPDTPTIAEAGLPNYEAVAWYALMAPANTPKPVIDKIANALKNMKSPDVQKKLIDQGTEPVISTPDVLASQIKTDVAGYRELIQATGIQIE
ncbi:MAG: tripartite tricarboxylate transporter substrate binding protein [Pseudomonadota bacterium]